MTRIEYELRSFCSLLFAGTAGVFLTFSLVQRSALLLLLGIITYMSAKVVLDKLVMELIGKDEL